MLRRFRQVGHCTSFFLKIRRAHWPVGILEQDLWYMQSDDPMAGLLLVDGQAMAALQPEATLSVEIVVVY